METVKPNARGAPEAASTSTTNHLASRSTSEDSFTTAIIAESTAAILESRGLDLELLAKLGWKSSAKITDGDAIDIPYLLNSDVVNVKTRTLSGEKRFSQVKDAVKCFYNADAIAEWKTGKQRLVICEGELDAVSAIQCGMLAVSVPDGAPAKQLNGDGDLKYSYLEGFPDKGEVILATDNDAAGINLMNDLALRLGRHRCLWVRYPDDCKDLNDVLRVYGREKVLEVLGAAEWLKVDGCYKMSDLPPVEKPEGHTLDIAPITLRKRDFSVLTGIPGHGKTTLSNYMAHDAAKRSNWRVCFASFEQEPQTMHRYNLRALALGMAVKHAQPDELAHADKWIDEHYSFIIPDIENDEETTLGWLLEKMAAAVFRFNPDMFVIDPWNEMDHGFDHREMSETKYTGFAIRQLKKFGRRYNVHIQVIAHPVKLQRNQKTGKYPDVSLWDIADSAHWRNKCDLGMVCQREDDAAILRVQKSRYTQEIGEPDDYRLSYDDTTKVYTKSGAVYSLAGDDDES